VVDITEINRREEGKRNEDLARSGDADKVPFRQLMFVAMTPQIEKARNDSRAIESSARNVEGKRVGAALGEIEAHPRALGRFGIIEGNVTELIEVCHGGEMKRLGGIIDTSEHPASTLAPDRDQTLSPVHTSQIGLCLCVGLMCDRYSGRASRLVAVRADPQDAGV